MRKDEIGTDEHGRKVVGPPADGRSAQVNPAVPWRWHFAGKDLLKRLVLGSFRCVTRLRSENAVLLTFDDGPDAKGTPRVLDLCRAHRARAVFFVVGNRIPRAPEMVRRAAAEGHVVGNHTFFHPLTHTPWLLPYVRDVSRCQAAIGDMIGYPPSLFRPPMGRTRLASLVAPKLFALRTVLWSVDADDWSLRSATAAIEWGQRLVERIQPGDIVLLHDDSPYVVPLLEVLLPTLSDRQCDLATGVELLPAGVAVNGKRAGIV